MARDRLPRRLLVGVELACAVAACATVLLVTLPGSDGHNPAERVVWSSNFAGGGFSEWSYWGQQQPSQWGHVAVVTAKAAGVPPDDAGTHVARLATTAQDVARGAINAKLYKSFSVLDADGRRHPPADVSGTYRATFFLPRSFRVPLGTWVNLFQFKEEHGVAGRSTPLWWVQLGTASWARRRHATWRTPKPRRADAPVLFLNYWGNRGRRYVFAAAPLGRWFEISARIRQRSSATFEIDGRRFDTATEREYPVSPFRSDALGFTFGIGDYGTVPGSELFVGSASYAVS